MEIESLQGLASLKSMHSEEIVQDSHRKSHRPELAERSLEGDCKQALDGSELLATTDLMAAEVAADSKQVADWSELAAVTY